MTICYHPHFLCIFKIRRILNQGSGGEGGGGDFKVKNAFLASFSSYSSFRCFSSFFTIFIFFFDKFSQQNNTKSETGIGDKKLRVEMYLFFLRQMQSMESKEKKYLSCLVSSPGNSGDCLHECVVFTTIFIQGYTKSSKTLYT